MLPRPDAPVRRLPYTTADMSERLAKRKAEQANQALRFGVTNPPAVKKDKPWYEDIGSAIGGAIKSVYDNIPMSNPISTPINMGGDAGVSIGGQGTGKSLVTEPARLAVRRAVGDITAIPRVGEPSPSYTADQIREQGVARGVLGAAIDYSQFIPVVAKGAGFTGDAVNAYKLAMMERQANPFPALRGASNVIDVVPGSRLPTRIVEPPATFITPATRLAEAQTARGLTATVDQPMTLPSKNITTIEKSASGGGQQKLVLTNSDGRRLATVTYDLRNDPMTAMPSRIEVDYLKSNFEGQGHGQELMQNLYDRYPNSFIDWGETINPTSTYMAEKFADRYYDRTAYEPNIDQGVVGTEGMYSGEPDVFKEPATPATRLGESLAQRTLDARAAQGGVRDAGVIRFPGGEPTPELPSAQLSQPAFRERQVPESTKITVEFNGQPSQQESQAFVIRAFDPTFNKYKGALTMEWDPQKGKAIVDGLGTTDAMVVPQILASAAHVVRKFYGNIQFPLEPSTNLSVHSRPLVERLQQARLVDPNFELPEPSQLNRITKQSSEPSDFAAPDAFFDTQVIDPLAYQPTYNDVLKKLVESKRQAKLQGEYGKLATSSKKLQKIEEQRDLNYAANYRANMEQFGFPVHPLFEQLSDARMNILLDEIKNDTQRGASILLDVWNKIDPALVENAGIFADSYAPTRENLLKFPQLLQDSNLIDGETRQRLLVELQNLLK